MLRNLQSLHRKIVLDIAITFENDVKTSTQYLNFQPPICQNGENLVKRRRKRQTRVIDETQGDLYDTDREDLKVKVYSGLYVNEASDLDDAFLDNEVPTEIVSYNDK